MNVAREQVVKNIEVHLVEELEASAQRQSPKVLVVERKLVRNRGHFHTQVSALQSLLPNHLLHLLTGDSYDGFLGIAAGKFGPDASRWSKLAARAKYGSARQRLVAILNMAVRGKAFIHPQTSIADTLDDTCRRLGLDHQDLVIIPTADLNLFEAAVALIRRRKLEGPTVCLRFLNSDLGEPDGPIRRRRLEAAAKVRSDKIALFSETAELAAYLTAQFGLAVRPHFYLPCSIKLIPTPSPRTSAKSAFRVGVFGSPRSDKGSDRITSIVQEISKSLTGDFPDVAIVIQGSASDFRSSGVYGGLEDLQTPKLMIEKHSWQIPDDEFVTLFRSIDAVLLPYDSGVYSLQGSGIVQDAVAARKIIVHTANMSMKEMLSHGNARAATTDEEFGHEIINAANLDETQVYAATDRAFVHFERSQQYHPILELPSAKVS